MVVPDRPGLLAVEFKRLTYEEVAGDRFRLTGEAADAPRRVTLHEAAANARQGLLQLGDGVVDSGMADNDDYDDDWSDVLPTRRSSQPPRRPPARRRQPGEPGIVEIVAGTVGLEEDLARVIDAGEEPQSDEGHESEESDAPLDAPEERDPPPETPVEMPLTLGNCIYRLWHVETIEDVQSSFPDFEVTTAWQVRQCSAGEICSKTRCIHGESLRTDCRVHGAPCKLHIAVAHDYQRCNAISMLWAIAGSGMSAAEHVEYASHVQGRWRAES